MDTAPTLVKACNQTVRKHFADWNIVVIDKNNLNNMFTCRIIFWKNIRRAL